MRLRLAAAVRPVAGSLPRAMRACMNKLLVAEASVAAPPCSEARPSIQRAATCLEAGLKQK